MKLQLFASAALVLFSAGPGVVAISVYGMEESDDKCDYDTIFRGHSTRTRADMSRSARNGNLKKDYPDALSDTKQARNQCKKQVGASECRDRGLCFEYEDDSDSYDNAESLYDEDEVFDSEDEEEYEDRRYQSGLRHRRYRDDSDQDADFDAESEDWNWEDAKKKAKSGWESTKSKTKQGWESAKSKSKQAGEWAHKKVSGTTTDLSGSADSFDEEYDMDDDPCSYDNIFSGNTPRTRAGMTRSARNGTLKQDYPDTWHDTRYDRNRCKKEVGTQECRDRGLCGEEEDEFEDLSVY